MSINCITTREQYDEVRDRVNKLIKEATQKGMLEPNADNEYIREIGRLAKMSAEYEDNYLNLKSASNLNGNLNCSKELEHYAS